MQVLGGLLAEEMVDPVHLRLVEHRVHHVVQLLEGFLRRAERFLVDDAGAGGQAVLTDRLGELGERHWWHGQVVHQLGIAAHLAPGLRQHLQQGARARRCQNRRRRIAAAN